MTAEQVPSDARIELTPSEFLVLVKLPGALRALADWHDEQESEAGSMGFTGSEKYHQERRLLLHNEADRIEKEWENG
jgi:hypothetical protein